MASAQRNYQFLIRCIILIFKPIVCQSRSTKYSIEVLKVISIRVGVGGNIVFTPPFKLFLNLNQGGKAAFARVIRASPGSFAPRQGFRTHFLQFSVWAYSEKKNGEIKKSKNESTIRCIWTTWKSQKNLNLLHKYLLWIWQNLFFEICTIFLLYESKKFAKGTCHRKTWKHGKKNWTFCMSFSDGP